MEFQLALEQTIEEVGLQSLKSKRLEVVEAFIAGKDVFAILPLRIFTPL